MSGDWYAAKRLAADLVVLTEPAVHDYFRANLYMLRGRDADLVVDSGMGLAPLRPHLPLVPGKPVIAVATHIHLDHVGSLHEFADRRGPARSAGAFATMPDEATYAHMFRDFPDPVSRPPSPGWGSAGYRLEPAPLAQALAEGDTIDLGDRRFTVVELPGHSPDSIGLVDQRDGTFFCGDALYPAGLIDDLPDSDREDYRATMQKILDLPVSAALGGHGDSLGAPDAFAVAHAYLRGERV